MGEAKYGHAEGAKGNTKKTQRGLIDNGQLIIDN
jgi:hypothetical protein